VRVSANTTRGAFIKTNTEPIGYTIMLLEGGKLRFPLAPNRRRPVMFPDDLAAKGHGQSPLSAETIGPNGSNRPVIDRRDERPVPR
jgi:hypothetical protein